MSETRMLKKSQLEIARRISTLHREAIEAQKALQEELTKRADRLSETFSAQMQAEWTLLFTELGLPQSEIGRWGLDARYFDEHGVAFLEKLGVCSCGQVHGENEGAAAMVHAVKGRVH